jgi:hypothetical protein
VAAWFGAIALGLNALVPIHLAFDLADAIEPANHAPTEAAGLDVQLLALLCGHQADSDHHRHHQDDKPGSHHGCAVCAAVTTLVALALPATATLHLPKATAVQPAAAAAVAAPSAILAAAYRSRAPPPI